jgi:hemerythrin-like metal-binding protein
MQWTSAYETGIVEIDQQHQTIVGLVTEFEAAIHANASWDRLYPLIARARDYAKFHFAVEESLMQILGYPRTSAHRSEHRFVLERIADLEQGVLRKSILEELAPQFRTWLLSHFLESDRHFAGFARAAGLRGAKAAHAQAQPRVLIADADEQHRDLLKLLLEANGFRVTLAGDGLQALAAARAERPDVVLSEVPMPNMDGFALCRAWMQDAALSAVPFIFYSGHQMRQDQEQFAQALGAARYLSKPLATESLLQELRSVLPVSRSASAA